MIRKAVFSWCSHLDVKIPAVYTMVWIQPEDHLFSHADWRDVIDSSISPSALKSAESISSSSWLRHSERLQAMADKI